MDLLVLILNLISPLALRAAVDQIPENLSDRDQWKTKRLSEIAASHDLPPSDAIQVLGDLVRQLSRSNYRESEEKDYIIQEAREALVAIPGHAEYYANRITAARDQYDAYKNADDGRYHKAKVDLLNEETYGFETLSQLPDPETVRVLCGLLDDYRGYHDPSEGMGIEVRASEQPINGGACGVLMKLPIHGKPYTGGLTEDTRENYEAIIDSWRRWYQQILAGKRTFRFEGSDIEYNLSGPVGVAAPPRLRSPLTAKPADDGKPSPSRNRSKWAILAASLALLGTGGWLASRWKGSGNKALL